MFTIRCEITFYKSDNDGPVYVVGQLNENKEVLQKNLVNLNFKLMILI